MIRIGQGYDLHRLVEGRDLILAGVKIPHIKRAHGHSDADALAHAVIDALLGAAALGDIGQHFPDTDPNYADADSMKLLQKTVELLCEQGWEVGNIDATVILQEPKLASHIEQMRRNLADGIGLDIGAVSVKAKTNEKVDAVGRGEAVAVHAIALIHNSR